MGRKNVEGGYQMVRNDEFGCGFGLGLGLGLGLGRGRYLTHDRQPITDHCFYSLTPYSHSSSFPCLDVINSNITGIVM